MWWMICDELLWTRKVVSTTGMIRHPYGDNGSAYTGLMGKRTNKRQKQKELSNLRRELDIKAKRERQVDELISEGLASNREEAHTVLRGNRRRPKWKQKRCSADIDG